MTDRHATAPTRYHEMHGARYAYRRWGAQGGVPLLLLSHLRAGMDHWDPLITDRLAADREIILFDGRGIGGSTGEPRESIELMADDVGEFLSGIDVPQVDAVGLSIGGMQVQELATRHPHLVRKLVLIGTGSRGFTRGTDPAVGELMIQPEIDRDDYGRLFFGSSRQAQIALREFWDRRLQRADLDPLSTPEVGLIQRAAVGAWRAGADVSDPHGYLSSVTQPALIVHGTDDAQILFESALDLVRHLPDAQLVMYGDAGHGPHLQFPERFVGHLEQFLAEQ